MAFDETKPRLQVFVKTSSTDGAFFGHGGNAEKYGTAVAMVNKTSSIDGDLQSGSKIQMEIL